MEIKKNNIDWFILLPVLGLMLFSIAFVYSASSPIAYIKFNSTEKLFTRHAIMIFGGIIIMIVFAKIDYHFWKKYSKIIIVFSILLLCAVLFFGSSAKGASRWLNLGPISFQPSEFAKFAMVLHFAALLDSKKHKIKGFWESFVPFAIWLGAICILIALQPNFSTMMVIFSIAFAMMFIGNVNAFYLLCTAFIAVFAGGIFALSASYRVNRFLAFLGMGNDQNQAVENVSYQLNQALLAIGNGGIHGLGPGQSPQSHLFLPESYGDFIFSIIGEEYGFIGLSLIILAFGIVFWRGMLVAKKAPDEFGYFLAVGILITFAIYVFVNAGVNTGLLPTTGVPMPFISYGGTAVFIYAAAIGILLNISSQAGTYQITKKL